MVLMSRVIIETGITYCRFRAPGAAERNMDSFKLMRVDSANNRSPVYRNRKRKENSSRIDKHNTTNESPQISQKRASGIRQLLQRIVPPCKLLGTKRFLSDCNFVIFVRSGPYLQYSPAHLPTHPRA